mmetsp:Transcript_8134/g.19160  ORF Transcript_8134/g.19160 Transcript_8134/m.19160 type:complete len:272 (-) Transcript_8134:106-921(-)
MARKMWSEMRKNMGDSPPPRTMELSTPMAIALSAMTTAMEKSNAGMDTTRAQNILKLDCEAMEFLALKMSYFLRSRSRWLRRPTQVLALVEDCGLLSDRSDLLHESFVPPLSWRSHRGHSCSALPDLSDRSDLLLDSFVPVLSWRSPCSFGCPSRAPGAPGRAPGADNHVGCASSAGTPLRCASASRAPGADNHVCCAFGSAPPGGSDNSGSGSSSVSGASGALGIASTPSCTFMTPASSEADHSRGAAASALEESADDHVHPDFLSSARS